MVSASENLLILFVLCLPFSPCNSKLCKEKKKKNRAVIMLEFDLIRLNVYFCWGCTPSPQDLYSFCLINNKSLIFNKSPHFHCLSFCQQQSALTVCFFPLFITLQHIFKQNKVSLNISHSGCLSSTYGNHFSECVA